MKRFVLWVLAALSTFVATSSLPSSFAVSSDDEKSAQNAVAVVDVGSTRQLFLDDYLPANRTDVEILVHRPEREEIAVQFDKPWEAIFTAILAF